MKSHNNTNFILIIGCVIFLHAAAFPQSTLKIWANEGGDKVTQEELRLSQPNGRKVLTRVWDGSKITVFGARNEVVNFNLVIEAPTQAVSSVGVSFNHLAGPGGASIQSSAAIGNGIFNWVNRPIELFYVRYLQIKGLSRLGYENYYDERHVPARFRRPWSGNGAANTGTTWQDRPDHDKFYPDIAVPLELVPAFSIGAGKNQSIWADIYIPKSAAPGLYQGQVIVTSGGISSTIPVELTVYNFSLPDVPSAKTMLDYSGENVNERYLGQTWISGAGEARAKLIQDRHFLLAHRHKISMIGDNGSMNSDYTTADQPAPYFIPRLKGDFFTSVNGYDGPGVNVGNNVYSVMTYGIPDSWKSDTAMRRHADGWVNWFEANAPGIEYFLYLIDESTDYAQTETWAQWLKNDPGPGSRLMSMATISLPEAVANTPSLKVVASAAGIGIPSQWEGPANQYSNDPNRRFYLYNGSRPASGCFMTEDDGVALRANAWIQFKKHVNRWFYWESTYYNDFQGGSGKMDLFQNAHTFGTFSTTDAVQGQTGWNYSNGDGVMFYPGTDTLFPASSYHVDGPFASLRMKQWRRGLQDHDYLTLAKVISQTVVDSIVNAIIPKVVWEVGVDELSDPTYVHTDISWPIDPDVWEGARQRLAGLLNNTSIRETPGVLKHTQRIACTQVSAGTVAITFDCPVGFSGQIDFRVYDMAGKLEKECQRLENSGSGLHTLDVKGLRRGLFYCQLTGNGFAQTRKILLIK
jgi:hypothetical protein